MDFFLFTLLSVFIIGLLIAVFALFSKRSSVEIKAADEVSYYNIESRIKAIDSSIDEADSAINELTGVSKNILSDIDNKYQELLYLYNLIDEKKKELKKEVVEAGSTKTRAFRQPQVTDNTERAAFSNPKLTDILEMQKNGKNIAEIAKTLNMGQGEVSLILGLSGNLPE